MIARALLSSLAMTIVLAAPAYATDEWGAEIEVMDDADLSDLRGGFAVDGMEIGFGALVTSYVNGAPVLSTQLTWTDMGAVIQETLSGAGQSLRELTPEARDALGVGDLDDANGVVINDQAGVTALIHNITDGALQNIIINSASDRDLRQEIDVTLTLPGFDAIQDALTLERFGMHLTDDMRGIAFGLPES
jgi:hypothetical protein